MKTMKTMSNLMVMVPPTQEAFTLGWNSAPKPPNSALACKQMLSTMLKSFIHIHYIGLHSVVECHGTLCIWLSRRCLVSQSPFTQPRQRPESSPPRYPVLSPHHCIQPESLEEESTHSIATKTRMDM